MRSSFVAGALSLLAIACGGDDADPPATGAPGAGGAGAASTGGAGAASSGAGGAGGATEPCVPATAWTGSQWPEADALFRQDPRWVGADAAFSIDLGDERSLWLFGDTFVDPEGLGERAGAAFPRNTVGIQTGRDPSTATMEFAWGGTDAAPASFFPDEGEHWFWPAHGIRRGQSLIVFLVELQPLEQGGPFPFEAVGAVAVTIDDPDQPPSAWQPQRLQMPAHPFGLLPGAAVVADDAWLYAFALREPGNHDVALARWALADVDAGDLSAPAWWMGGDSWEADPPADPAPVWLAGAPETSVVARCGAFVSVESVGFGATTIGVRDAPAPAGPWSSIDSVFTPPEGGMEDVFIYAGKAHRELAGADLVVTYAANSFDFADVIADNSLYFPRFVRLDAAR